LIHFESRLPLETEGFSTIPTFFSFWSARLLVA
jgi:hypothetical protein